MDFQQYFNEKTGGPAQLQFPNMVDAYLFRNGWEIGFAGGIVPERFWVKGPPYLKECGSFEAFYTAHANRVVKVRNAEFCDMFNLPPDDQALIAGIQYSLHDEYEQLDLERLNWSNGKPVSKYLPQK
jgi:hypothetical protein